VGLQGSLAGWGHPIHVRCNFHCQYCGFDGRSFPNWFQLTVDHILPRQQGGSDELENLVTACSACNSITSQMKFEEGVTREEILEAKIERVHRRQSEFFEFWSENVAPLYIADWQPERDEPRECVSSQQKSDTLGVRSKRHFRV